VDEAVTAYQQAIQANPKLALAYNNLGAAYERQGKRSQAIDEYRRALQIDPGYADAKRNLSRLTR
jgi:superkiller protein 3